MKEEKPRYEDPYNYLENPEIRELDQLVQRIIALETSREARDEALTSFQGKWTEMVSQYSNQAQTNAASLRQLMKFDWHTMFLLDRGGMSKGRSRISVFLTFEHDKLIARFPELMDEIRDEVEEGR